MEKKNQKFLEFRRKSKSKTNKQTTWYHFTLGVRLPVYPKIINTKTLISIQIFADEKKMRFITRGVTFQNNLISHGTQNAICLMDPEIHSSELDDRSFSVSVGQTFVLALCAKLFLSRIGLEGRSELPHIFLFECISWACKRPFCRVLWMIYSCIYYIETCVDK